MKTALRTLLALGLGLPAISAQAGIILSQAVVDIDPKAPLAQDIEVWNDSTDVTYVVAEPSEIRAPGLPNETRVKVDDPSVGGLLVTPQRLILQPGERKLVRVAAVTPRGASDRVWRVTIKPVAGPITAEGTALKLMVGYDVLVLLRPATEAPKVSGTRSGQTLVLHNDGNTNVEMYQGTQCSDPKTCKPLPARRLYPGEGWTVPLPGAGAISYHVAVGQNSSTQQF